MKPQYSIKKSIQHFIANDKLQEAVELLIAVTEKSNSEFHSSTLLLSRKLFSLEKAIINGILSWEKMEDERGKVAIRLLKLVNLLMD